MYLFYNSIQLNIDIIFRLNIFYWLNYEENKEMFISLTRLGSNSRFKKKVKDKAQILTKNSKSYILF